VLTGGGANSAVWRQVVADVCRLPVTVLEQDEGASFGAALQALWALKRQSDASLEVADVVAEHLSRKEAFCTEPAARSADLYAERYDAYRKAVDHVAPLYLH
jgi:xylulokinase